MTAVLFAYADVVQEWNCSEWRQHTPSNGLNAAGHRGRMLPLGDFMQYGHPVIQQFVSEFDVIVVQRNLFEPQVWAACDYWRALDKLVCADLDDDYPRLTPQNPAHMFWIKDASGLERRTGLPPVKALEEGLRHVDALIAPSRTLLADWADVVPGMYFPNLAHGPWYESIEQKPLPGAEEPVVIGWGGSVSHFDSWWFSGMMDAALSLMAAYPFVQFKVCGNDWRLLSELRRRWPAGRWVHQPGVPPDQWPQVVASFDIGLAPLCGPGFPQGQAYDQRRSSLKAVEYLLCGVPWLASPGPVYEELAGQGGECVAEDTPQAWHAAVAAFVEDLPACKAASKELMSWAWDTLVMENRANDFVVQLQKMAAEKHSRRGIRLPDVIYVADMLKAEEIVGEKTGEETEAVPA